MKKMITIYWDEVNKKVKIKPHSFVVGRDKQSRLSSVIDLALCGISKRQLIEVISEGIANEISLEAEAWAWAEAEAVKLEII